MNRHEAHALELINDPDFECYFKGLSVHQQQQILSAFTWAPFYGRHTTEAERIACNRLLSWARPVIEWDFEDEEGTSVFSLKSFHRFVKDGKITLYRGCCLQEAERAKAGDVKGLGFCWTPRKSIANGYALRHDRGNDVRIMCVTIPKRFVKMAYSRGSYENEMNIAPPEFWPYITRFRVLKSRRPTVVEQWYLNFRRKRSFLKMAQKTAIMAETARKKAEELLTAYKAGQQRRMAELDAELARLKEQC